MFSSIHRKLTNDRTQSFELQNENTLVNSLLLENLFVISGRRSKMPHHLLSELHHSVIFNQCHCSISLAPNTLWLAIPAATDPVFRLPFFFSLLSKDLYSNSFLEKFSHISRTYSSCPINFPPFLRKLIPLPPCQWFVSFCLWRLVVTLLA